MERIGEQSLNVCSQNTKPRLLGFLSNSDTRFWGSFRRVGSALEPQPLQEWDKADSMYLPPWEPLKLHPGCMSKAKTKI